ncbi:MAG TPA: M4 family metallopeptidase [Burkholderiaceae bacterium]
MNQRFPRLGALTLAALVACGTAFAATPEAQHPAVQRALAHLGANAQAAWASAGDEFVARDLHVDADGTEHVHFHRTHLGLRVIGGDFITHVDGHGQLREVTHALKAPIAVSTVAKTEAAAAEKRAAAAFKGNVDSAKAELVIYAHEHAPVLAYDVRIVGADKHGNPTREHVILAADDLAVLDGWSELQPVDAVGTGVTHYAGTVSIHTDHSNGTYSLVDNTRGGHTVYDLANKNGQTTSSKGTLMTDADNQWGDGVQSKTSQSDGVDAMYGQNMTWDFYKATFGRNGIADDGRGAYSRVHSKATTFTYNAWWDDSCFCMTYTSELNASSPALLSLDVAGHEMTHGVTANTAGLVYSKESGGLNEGTSDIMGTMVEFFANNPNDPPDYTMGENFGTPLRYMYQPSKDGHSADCWYSNVGGLNVHYSSGVANHVFYLMAQGTNPSGFPASKTCKAGDTKTATGTGTLVGLGNAKAQAIWYRALTTYFTSTTNYAAARTATLKAAADLYGGTGTATYNAVAAAWSAVLVN